MSTTPSSFPINNSSPSSPSTPSLIVPLLDFTIPLLPQIKSLNRTQYIKILNFYHVTERTMKHYKIPSSLYLFSNPYLELFSRTPWYIIPIFWIPVIFSLLFYAYCLVDNYTNNNENIYVVTSTSSFPNVLSFLPHSLSSTIVSFHTSFFTMDSPQVSYFTLSSVSEYFSLYTLLFFTMGIYLWTLLEYILHRFFFHSELWIPEKYLYLSFLFHGIHHIHPLDRYRLVMPLSVSIPLVLLFSISFRYVLFPLSFISLPLYIITFSGGIFGYLGYDMIHYGTHHIALRTSKYLPYFYTLQTRHIKHHINSQNIFGVSNTFWDTVFGTNEPKLSIINNNNGGNTSTNIAGAGNNQQEKDDNEVIIYNPSSITDVQSSITTNKNKITMTYKQLQMKKKFTK